MNFRSIDSIHFIGCSGVGTQPLALICHELGKKVSGSDIADGPLAEQLRKLGIPVKIGHAAENIPPGTELVVYTSAAKADNPELTEARRRKIPCLRRGEALAGIAELFPVVIGVAGSHGKTSVTAMITHILKENNWNPGFLIGGAVPGWNASGSAGGGKIFVSEVDESDSTNAFFHASTAVITNIEDDHAWSTGGTENLYRSFQTFSANSKKTLAVADDNTVKLLRNAIFISRVVVNNDFPADWGEFQRINAKTAETAIRMSAELTEEQIRSAIRTFPGVERRMSLRFNGKTVKLMEDYAHHPTELAASLDALRHANPDRKLIVVFQPHRYARLQRYFDRFTALLKTADKVYVAPVFAAWCDKSEVDSAALAARIPGAELLPDDWASAASQIVFPEHSVIAVIGAGSVNRILPFLKARLNDSRS